MKNKEIEEVLNELKRRNERYNYCKNNEISFSDNDYNSHLLLSYIEQLETNYKEANESITWWQNRYNAIVKQNDDNHKNVVKLQNNRDKAIEEIEKQEDYFNNYPLINKQNLLNILKGGSDE